MSGHLDLMHERLKRQRAEKGWSDCSEQLEKIAEERDQFRAQVAALTHDLANERKENDEWRKTVAAHNEQAVKAWERDVEKLRAEVERLRDADRLAGRALEAKKDDLIATEADRDKYKAALERIVTANWAGECEDGYSVAYHAMKALAEAVQS